MKPKDLPAPFRFEERRIVLSRGILHVPPHMPNYAWDDFPGWNKIFGNNRPLQVEYCAGHGHWVIERACRAPDENWVAVEKRFDRVRRIWAKRENKGIKNLFIVCGEAECVTQHYFGDESVASCFINFPDPWPKKRHAKHRLIHEGFLQQVARISQPASPLMLATDDQETASRFIHEVGPVKEWHFSSPSPHYVHEWPGYGDSVFRSLWHREGKLIHYIQVRRQ